jgi:hypothetical protein
MHSSARLKVKRSKKAFNGFFENTWVKIDFKNI